MYIMWDDMYVHVVVDHLGFEQRMGEQQNWWSQTYHTLWPYQHSKNTTQQKQKHQIIRQPIISYKNTKHVVNKDQIAPCRFVPLREKVQSLRKTGEAFARWDHFLGSFGTTRTAERMYRKLVEIQQKQVGKCQSSLGKNCVNQPVPWPLCFCIGPSSSRLKRKMNSRLDREKMLWFQIYHAYFKNNRRIAIGTEMHFVAVFAFLFTNVTRRARTPKLGESVHEVASWGVFDSNVFSCCCFCLLYFDFVDCWLLMLMLLLFINDVVCCILLSAFKHKQQTTHNQMFVFKHTILDNPRLVKRVSRKRPAWWSGAWNHGPSPGPGGEKNGTWPWLFGCEYHWLK